MYQSCIFRLDTFRVLNLTTQVVARGPFLAVFQAVCTAAVFVVTSTVPGVQMRVCTTHARNWPTSCFRRSFRSTVERRVETTSVHDLPVGSATVSLDIFSFLFRTLDEA